MPRNLKGREVYPNDDYSRYAGPGYNVPEENFGIGEIDPTREKVLQRIRSKGPAEHPGHQSHYQTQKNFIGKGPKGYQRSDARILEEVCEALKHAREVDASEIEVEVRDGVVGLKGMISDRHAKVLAEKYVDSIKGVNDVMNQLSISHKIP